MRGAMQLPFIALLVLTATHAAEASADTAKGVLEESILRVRSLPATNNLIEKNWTSLSDTLDIFSARNLVRNWAEGKHAVGAQCDKDITAYVEALKNQELWALKGECRWFYNIKVNCYRKLAYFYTEFH